MKSPLWLLALAGGLWALPASAQDRPSPPRPPPQADPKQALSPEDQEVVENLELLEHLDETQELDTMLELAKVQAPEDGEGDPR